MSTTQVLDPDAADKPAQAPTSPAPIGEKKPSMKQRVEAFIAWVSRTNRRFDLVICVGYVLLAVMVTSRLWVMGKSGVASANPEDQEFLEWNLRHAAYSLTHWENPLFSEKMNAASGGVNLMANTSILAIGLPLTPITLLFGPHVSYALLVVFALAGTAAGWYYVLSRYVVESRWAAALGGAFAGFAPGMISHAGGQANISAHFLVPFLVLLTFRLGQPKKRLRYATALGLLAVVQVFINEETLFFTGLGCVFALATFAWTRRAEARQKARGFLGALAFAMAVALVFLAYPLWFQFFGPQHYRGLPFATSKFVADLMSFPGLARESLGGSDGSAASASLSPTEDNAFYGWGLLALVIGVAIWQWRELWARMAAVTAIGFVLLGIGPNIAVSHHRTWIPGPMVILQHLPVFDLITITRFSLMVAPCIAILLAMGVDRFWKLLQTLPKPNVARWLAFCLLLVALVPIFPTPLSAERRHVPPAFITDGSWRELTGPTKTILVVPVPTREVLSMSWSTQTGLQMSTAQGYFLGPDAHSDDAIFGAPKRPTIKLLNKVESTGKKPKKITDEMKQQALEDLRYLRVGLLVLNPYSYEDAVLETLEELYGKGKKIDGAWTWQVR